MRLNFKEILEGWRNLLVPPADMKKFIEDVAEERMNICRACPHFSTNAKANGYHTLRFDEHCTKCGCPLISKTVSLSSACPLNFWEAVTNDEEKYEIEKQIKNENSQIQEGDPKRSEEPSGDLS